MSKIMITIKDGEIISKVVGISGSKCTDVDKFLKSMGEVVEIKKTKEYYQSEVEVNTHAKLQR